MKINVSGLVKKVDYDAKIWEKEKNILLLLIIIIHEYSFDAENTKKLVNEYKLNKKIRTWATKEEIKVLVTKKYFKRFCS